MITKIVELVLAVMVALIILTIVARGRWGFPGLDDHELLRIAAGASMGCLLFLLTRKR